jgi:hypothetical protein
MIWPLSRTFHALGTPERVRSLEFMLRCRNVFLAFTRYGSSRTRVVLEAADGIETQRVGPERAEQLFHAWLAYQRLERNSTDAEIEGNYNAFSTCFLFFL